MFKPIYLATVPALCLSLLPAAATAQTAIFAAQTGVSTISPCPSFCGGSGGVSDFDSDGVEGFTTSFSSLNNVDGDGQAQSDLNGPTDLPTLRAEAFSHAQVGTTQRSSRVAAQAFGLQGFYVAGTSYTLDITLSGIANDVPEPANNVFNEDGNALAHVMIIRDNDPSSDISFTSHYATMKFELIDGNELELLTETFGATGQTLVIPPDNQVHSVSDSLTVTGLIPGELIYVWADLAVSGTRGGFGDAFSTLTMAFQDPTGLTHTPPPAIPEPSEYLLLLAGLGLIGVATRRTRA